MLLESRLYASPSDVLLQQCKSIRNRPRPNRVVDERALIKQYEGRIHELQDLLQLNSQHSISDEEHAAAVSILMAVMEET
jgi:hypothetical protein